MTRSQKNDKASEKASGFLDTNHWLDRMIGGYSVLGAFRLVMIFQFAVP